MAKRREPVRTRKSAEPAGPGQRRDAARRRSSGRDSAAARRAAEAPIRGRRPVRERPQRPTSLGPQTSPIPRPTEGPSRPKNAAQAKARAKARKAKAPKVVRPPLRERILVRLAAIELNPRQLVTRVPFVVLVIGALGIGLGVTLWLSTDAAQRSYQLGHARETNQALLQQKEALERDVLEAQAAPALAESARQLGMIPSRDTAHLVQDPNGVWTVVGTPKPAEGVPPPPLNAPLPDPAPPAPPARPAPQVTDPREQVVRVPARVAPQRNPEVPVPGAVLAAPAAPLPGAPVPAAPAAVPPGAPLAETPAPAGVPDAAMPAAPLGADAQHLPTPEVPALPGPPVAAEPAVAPVAPGAPA